MRKAPDVPEPFFVRMWGRLLEGLTVDLWAFRKGKWGLAGKSVREVVEVRVGGR